MPVLSKLGVLAFSALAVSCPPEPPTPQSSALAVAMRPQETPMWCWAASGQMVMATLGTSPTQCTQANDRFNRNDCPCAQCGASPVGSPPCVNGGWPDFARYDFTFQRTSSAALPENAIRTELCQGVGCGGAPIAFSWAWTGGGGHMMVLTGYQVINGTLFVTVQDPWGPCVGDTRIITYAAYVSDSGYTHWDDFYQIRPI